VDLGAFLSPLYTYGFWALDGCLCIASAFSKFTIDGRYIMKIAPWAVAGCMYRTFRCMFYAFSKGGAVACICICM